MTFEEEELAAANKAHSREWWATYRAALTGRCAYAAVSDDMGSVDSYSDSAAHESAEFIANLAHGPRKDVKL